MDVNVALITIGFLYLALAVWAVAKLFIQARRERRRLTIVKQDPGVPHEARFVGWIHWGR